MESRGAVRVPHFTKEQFGEEGGSAHSHSRPRLHFPNSDGTDRNPSRHAVSSRERPRVLALGSCHLHNAVQKLGQSGDAKVVFQNYSQTHSTSEMLQLVRYYLGKTDIPTMMNTFFIETICQGDFLETGKFLETDFAILEICHPYSIEFGGVSINRTLLWQHLVEPLRSLENEELWIAAQRWYFNGIMELRYDLVAEHALTMLEHMPAATPTNNLHRLIVSGITIRKMSLGEMEAHIEEIRRLIAAPLAIALHTRRYMPDGRPLSWPPDLARQVAALAANINVPLVLASDIVRQLGVDVALSTDFSYYTEPMNEKYAIELSNLINQVV